MADCRTDEEESLWQEKYQHFREHFRFNKKQAYVAADLMVKVFREVKSVLNSPEQAVA